MKPSLDPFLSTFNRKKDCPNEKIDLLASLFYLPVASITWNIS